MFWERESIKHNLCTKSIWGFDVKYYEILSKFKINLSRKILFIPCRAASCQLSKKIVDRSVESTDYWKYSQQNLNVLVVDWKKMSDFMCHCK